MRHHLDPVSALERYPASSAKLAELGTVLELTAAGSRFSQSWLSQARQQGFLARDTWVQQRASLRQRIAQANELQPVDLSNRQVADLLAFLDSLTDPASLELDSLVPARVPSGLPVED